MHSELVAIGTNGLLYCWKWSDPEPYRSAEVSGIFVVNTFFLCVDQYAFWYGEPHTLLSHYSSSSTKTECDYLCGWIKIGHMRKNLTQNSEPQRYSWECRRRTGRTMAHNVKGETSHIIDILLKISLFVFVCLNFHLIIILNALDIWWTTTIPEWREQWASLVHALSGFVSWRLLLGL